MQNFIAGLVFLCLPATFLTAQSITQQLDQVFEAFYAPDQPGASILISQGDQLVYERQIGLANVEHASPISTASVFSAGSISKQFTVAAMFQLEEAGKLRLTDTLQHLLPDYSLPEAPITLRQLINHTSGVRDYPRVKKIRQIIRNEPVVDTIIELALAAGLDFPPGTKFSYSNTGYLLLGKVIELASGQSFETYLRDNIFVPAQMEATSFTHFRSVLPARTTPYSFDEDQGLTRAAPHAYSFAAGGLMTTARDLNKWIRTLRSGSLIGPASTDQMFVVSPEKETPYYGWEVNEVAGQLSYEHTGFEPGYKASSLYLPESDLYVIVLQNTEHGSPTPAAIKAAAIALKAPYPSADKEMPAETSLLKRFTGQYAFPGGNKRIVGLKDGRLFYQAPGGVATPLFVRDSLTLFFEQGYRQLHLTPAAADTPKSLTYQNRAFQQPSTLITEATPAEKKAIKVPEKVLAIYTGEYKTEHFPFVVKLEDGQLLGGPDATDMMPLTPFAAHKFFIPELGAEVTFEIVEGKAVSIKILLEGEIYQGPRL